MCAARHCRSPYRSRRHGWSLLSLVVTMLIALDLLCLLMPWIVSLGESARSNVCGHNLELLGRASIEHAAAHRFYPSGGRGYSWIGDPDRDFGAKQPGGWMYSILPFLDQKNLWELGAATGNPLAPARKRKALVGQITTVIPEFYCPTRRDAGLFPYRARNAPDQLPPSSIRQGVIKSDFAINVGDVPENQLGPGPKSYLEGDNPNHGWPDTEDFTGVSFLRSEVSPTDITGGRSETYLIGEKYLKLGALHRRVGSRR